MGRVTRNARMVMKSMRAEPGPSSGVVSWSSLDLSVGFKRTFCPPGTAELCKGSARPLVTGQRATAAPERLPRPVLANLGRCVTPSLSYTPPKQERPPETKALARQVSSLGKVYCRCADWLRRGRRRRRLAAGRAVGEASPRGRVGPCC